MSEQFVGALKHEVAEEKAGALGRCGREACGLRDSRHALKSYDIPREVIARVGARRPKS
jgi:hypothetical protein